MDVFQECSSLVSFTCSFTSDVTNNVLIFFFSDFLPGAGPLLHLSTPQPSDTIRVETGVRQGIVIPHDLVLINRAGGLYGRILTEIRSTDRIL